MNKKLFAVFLAAALNCAMLFGCSANAPKESTATEIAGATDETETAAQTTETNVTADAEFVFDDAVNNIVICGHEINYPLTLGDLGDDFTLDLWNSEAWFEDFMCSLGFKGECIGTVTFNDIDSADKINENTYISGILVSENDYDFDEVPILVNGIGFGDSRGTVYKVFGECQLPLSYSDMYKEVRGELRSLTFDYSYPNYDTISCISLEWN